MSLIKQLKSSIMSVKISFLRNIYVECTWRQKQICRIFHVIPNLAHHLPIVDYIDPKHQQGSGAPNDRMFLNTPKMS